MYGRMRVCDPPHLLEQEGCKGEGVLRLVCMKEDDGPPCREGKG